MIVGYTQGVFDLFHRGHLNLLKSARELCDSLIVGVNSDALVLEYKDIVPIYSQEDRLAIVSELKCVDRAFIADTLDKVAMHERWGFNKIFIGDDWKGNERWERTERDMDALGVEFVWVSYTDGVSSTYIRSKLGI